MFTVNTKSWHYRIFCLHRERAEGETAQVGISYVLHIGLNAAAVTGVAAASLILPTAAFLAVVLFSYWSIRGLSAAALVSLALAHTPVVTTALTVIGFMLIIVAAIVLALRFRRRDGWSGLTDRPRHGNIVTQPPTGPSA